MGAKTHYTVLKKIAYTFLMASRKLWHYFLTYDITVPTLYPLGDIFRNREATRRIDKWAVELAPFVVRFVARTAIKSQILVDFITEWTPTPAEPAATPPQDIWTIYTDGAYGSMGAEAGAVLISLTGLQVQFAAHLDFKMTNNIDEYKAVLLGLRKASALGQSESSSKPTPRSSQATSTRASKFDIRT